MFDKFAD